MVEDAPSSPLSDPEFTDCPQCAEPVRTKAKVCRFCGFDLLRLKPAVLAGGFGPSPGSFIASKRQKSAVVAVLLAMLFPGFGHFYAGENRRGFAYLVALVSTATVVRLVAAQDRPSDGAVALFFLGLLVVAILSITQVVSAARAVGRANRRERHRRWAAWAESRR